MCILLLHFYEKVLFCIVSASHTTTNNGYMHNEIRKYCMHSIIQMKLYKAVIIRLCETIC